MADSGDRCNQPAGRPRAAAPSREQLSGPVSDDRQRTQPGAGERRRKLRADVLLGVDARVKLVCLAMFVIVSLHANTVASLAICAACAIASALAVGVGPFEMGRVLRPLAPIVVVTAIMQLASFQQGAVLFAAGPVTVTSEAVFSAVRMIVGLFCVMTASVSFMRCTSSEELIRALAWFLGPFHALGLRVEAFMLSVSIAFRFVPVLAHDFGRLRMSQIARCGSFEGGVRDRLSAYMRLFPPLVRGSYRRADALAEAFVARCFSYGPRRTSLHVASCGAREVAFAFSAVAMCVVAWVV